MESGEWQRSLDDKIGSPAEPGIDDPPPWSSPESQQRSLRRALAVRLHGDASLSAPARLSGCRRRKAQIRLR
jgi:hypothetical protein